MYEEHANRVGRFSIGSAGRGRRRSVLCAVFLLPVLAAVLFVPPAAAQSGSEDPELVLREDREFADSAGPKERGYYEVYEDGTFVTGGDVVGSCDVLVREYLAAEEEVSPDREARRQVYREILRQVRICTRAGFPPPGAEALPGTGGPPLPIIAAALLLLGGALCAFGVRR